MRVVGIGSARTPSIKPFGHIEFIFPIVRDEIDGILTWVARIDHLFSAPRHVVMTLGLDCGWTMLIQDTMP